MASVKLVAFASALCYIGRLPLEITSLVFFFALAPLTPLGHSYANRRRSISLVCRTWHNLVYTTPSAWSTIKISPRVFKDLSYMKLALKNGRNHGFTVAMSATSSVDPSLDSAWKEHRAKDIADVVLPFTREAFSLLEPKFAQVVDLAVMAHDSQVCDAIAQCLSTFDGSKLEVLHLDLNLSMAPTLFTRPPTLRSLSLSWFFPADWSSVGMWSKLTDLRLVGLKRKIGLEWETLRNIIATASALRSLQLMGVECADNQGTQSVAANALSSLQFRFGSLDAVKVVSRIHTPSMETLRLDIHAFAAVDTLLSSCKSLLSSATWVELRLPYNLGDNKRDGLFTALSQAKTLDFRLMESSDKNTIPFFKNKPFNHTSVTQIVFAVPLPDSDILSICANLPSRAALVCAKSKEEPWLVIKSVRNGVVLSTPVDICYPASAPVPPIRIL
ncbi:hypothetical protein DFH06DRAFT_1318520 [Mycena polygramma]|nr:hypothetical protein DFH06DRAFT_1318520 [Mycena polygramma]